MSGWDNPLDLTAMELVVGHRTEWATSVAKAVMWVGTTRMVLALAVAVVAVAVLVMRAWRPALAAGIALVAAAFGAAALKAVFERPRPPAEFAMVAAGGHSFPSTQATETAAIIVAVLLSAPWGRRAVPGPAAVCLVGATALVGACMVYLGAHWPTDVLAGWALGVLIGSGVSRAVVVASRGAGPGAGRSRDQEAGTSFEQ